MPNKLFYQIRELESRLDYVSFLWQTEWNEDNIKEVLEEVKEMIDLITNNK